MTSAAGLGVARVSPTTNKFWKDVTEIADGEECNFRVKHLTELRRDLRASVNQSHRIFEASAEESWHALQTLTSGDVQMKFEEMQQSIQEEQSSIEQLRRQVEMMQEKIQEKDSWISHLHQYRESELLEKRFQSQRLDANWQLLQQTIRV